MIDKIEYSDLYKFLSSIGLVLIVASLSIPFFIFQIDILKHYRNLNLKVISEISRKSIQIQENSINLILNYWWILSGFLFLGGAIILFIGIKKWNKRQKVCDKTQDISLQEKEKLIQPASAKAINKKIEDEADLEGSAQSTIMAALKNYKSVESKVVDAVKTVSPSIKINPQARVGNFVYDLIIIERKSPVESIHKVCEIKYYQKEIFYSYIKHGVSSFLLAAENYQKIMVLGDNRIRIEYYLIWICINDEQIHRLGTYVNMAERYSIEKGIKLNIILKKESEINSIKIGLE